jgi:hypothetical protein
MTPLTPDEIASLRSDHLTQAYGPTLETLTRLIDIAEDHAWISAGAARLFDASHELRKRYESQRDELEAAHTALANMEANTVEAISYLELQQERDALRSRVELLEAAETREREGRI